jgi:hypothetical protein
MAPRCSRCGSTHLIELPRSDATSASQHRDWDDDAFSGYDVYPATPRRRPPVLIALGSLVAGMGQGTYLFAGVLDFAVSLLLAYALWGAVGVIAALVVFPAAMIGVPLLVGFLYGVWQPLIVIVVLCFIAFLAQGIGKLLMGQDEPRDGLMYSGMILGFLGLCLFWTYLALLAGAIEIVDPDGTVRPLLTR